MSPKRISASLAILLGLLVVFFVGMDLMAAVTEEEDEDNTSSSSSFFASSDKDEGRGNLFRAFFTSLVAVWSWLVAGAKDLVYLGRTSHGN